jgi:hypothetical protein
MPIGEDMDRTLWDFVVLVVSVSNLAPCPTNDDTALYPQPRSSGG